MLFRSAQLRREGIRTQIYMEKKKFKAKIGYADKLHMPFALFLGEDEIQNGTATIKNMVTGEQITDAVASLVPVIRATIDEKRAEPMIIIK